MDWGIRRKSLHRDAYLFIYTHLTDMFVFVPIAMLC